MKIKMEIKTMKMIEKTISLAMCFQRRENGDHSCQLGRQKAVKSGKRSLYMPFESTPLPHSQLISH
jgi:hypothetical protein